MAKSQAHAPGLEHTLSTAAKLYYLRREPDKTRTYATSAIAICEEYDIQMRLALGLIYQGWAVTMQNQEQADPALIQQGLEALRGRGGMAFMAHYLALLAESFGQSYNPRAGLDVVAEALQIVDSHGSHFSEAELH